MASQTFTVVDADDYWVYRATGGYPPSGTTFVQTTGFDEVQVSRYKTSGTNYQLSVGLLKFDTSSLPDAAVITAATLRVYVTDNESVDSLNLTADWYLGTVTTSDYTATPGTDALSGVAITSLTTTSDNDLALTNVAANISTTGSTGLRLHVSQRAADAAPTGRNEVLIADASHATAPEARLIVTYSSGVSYLVGAVHV